MEHVESLHEPGNQESEGGNVFQYLLDSALQKHVLL